MKDLSFNLSHTRGLACCVIGRYPELGVDAECPRRLRDIDAIARRFFSPGEYRDLSALADPARRYRHFLRLWCLKEAYVKAQGVGLALGLEGFGFTLDGQRVGFQIGDDPGAALDWRFALLDAGGGCPIAIAARPTGGAAPVVEIHGVAVSRDELPPALVTLGSSDGIGIRPSPGLVLGGD